MHHTHNAPRTFVDYHAASDGVALGPITARHCLVDDRYIRRSGIVVVAELAPLLHRNAHGVKKVRALEVGDDGHLFALGRNVSGNTEILRIALAVVAHRQMRRQRGFCDAGHCPHPIKQCSLQGESSLLGISRAG